MNINLRCLVFSLVLLLPHFKYVPVHINISYKACLNTIILMFYLKQGMEGE